MGHIGLTVYGGPSAFFSHFFTVQAQRGGCSSATEGSAAEAFAEACGAAGGAAFAKSETGAATSACVAVIIIGCHSPIPWFVAVAPATPLTATGGSARCWHMAVWAGARGRSVAGKG